ncbi:MAG: sodium-dependent transporter [Candidatus Sumerlaeia bacterium]
MAHNNDSWGSKIGVILAVAGSAVGLGNFLRFPGQVATNGGGIFMIPYFISLLLVGIPICWAEWTMGRYGGAVGHNSTPGIFRALWRHPASKYIGILSITIPVVIYMYYIYIEVWCLSYALDYVLGNMRAMSAAAAPGQDIKIYEAHFAAMVGAAANGFPGGRMMFLVALTFFLNFFLIFRGVSKGIESFSKIAMPLLIVIAVVIVLRVLTLGAPNPAMPERNIVNALGFMWNPRVEGASLWTALLNPKLWLSAAGQIFFTLSICMGVILNYASYLKRDDDVVLSGLTASAVNEFCEVCLGGMMVIPLAFMFLDVRNVQLDSTFSVAFTVLPTVFHRMPLGDMFGALFFAMIFIAAITSSISMLQPAIAFLEEGFAMGRRLSVTLLALIVSIGALIAIFFSKNLLALDTMDFWVGNFLVFVLGMIQIILFGWVFGVERAKAEISKGAEIPVPRPFWFVVKYVSPVYLLAIFAGFCYDKLAGYYKTIFQSEDRVAAFVLTFVLAVALFFAVLIWLAGKRWEEKHPISEEDVIP